MKKSKILKKLHSVAKGITALGLVSCLTALPLMASSHAEAPLISMDRYADNTDVYAFRSMETNRSGFVTLIANYIPFQDPSGGPQFYRFDDSVLYEINIDNTGDGLPDISYQFRFNTVIRRPDTAFGHTTKHNAASDGVVSTLNDPDYNMPQFYSVTRHNHNTNQDTVLATGIPTPPSNVGPRVTPNYEQNLGSKSVHTLATTGPNAGTRVFAGQRDEGFLVDVGAAFDLLNFRSLVEFGGGVSTTDGLNVNSIAIEVPISALTIDGGVPASATADNAVIGVYATASRQSTRVIGALNARNLSGNFVQVSRLGNPLVNELIVPLGYKDAFNAIRPHDDAGVQPVIDAVLNPEIAQALVAVGAVPSVPPAPRNDIAQVAALGIPNNSAAGTGYTTVIYPSSIGPNGTSTVRGGNDGKPHEEMRLNLGIPPTAFAQINRLGLLGGDVAGYPNGRRVQDDVTDITLRLVAGGTPFTPTFYKNANNTFTKNANLGDGVMGNDVCINPMTGDPAGGYVNGANIGGGCPGSPYGNDDASKGATDYLQRFPYLAPPQQGNQPKMSNYRQ